MDNATVSMEPLMVLPYLLPMIRRLHTSCSPHRLHTVESTDRRRPAPALRLRRRRVQSDCSFRRHRHAPPSLHLCRDPPSSDLLHAPPSSHLLIAPPSSHRRLHWRLASCAHAPRLLCAPPSSHRRLHCPSASCACAAPLARPTVFTPSGRGVAAHFFNGDERFMRIQ